MSDEKKQTMALTHAEWQRARDLQSLAMAAHLCDELALKSRQGWRFGYIESVARIIAALVHHEDPAGMYRVGLTALGLTPETIDAAVASILADEHPPVSLAGRVAKFRDKAAEEAAERRRIGNGFDARTNRLDGEAHAFDRVLDMLGVKH